MRKLLVLGLDSVPPAILYERSEELGLTNLANLVAESRRYNLRSCYPPITIPAWICMFTGLTPGELGIYGFRHRKPGDVRESYIVNSSHVKHATLWEEASRQGLKVGVIGVPPTYPPKPVNGFMITDFTTPGPEKPYTWPPWLKKEIEGSFGKYIFDVVYRSHDKKRVFKELQAMIRQHLAVMKYLLSRKSWDLFIYVEIAFDRAHHAFWKYFDKTHPRYTEDPELSDAIPSIYREFDKWLGEVIKAIPRDTVIVLVSDHGTKHMKGAFAVNEWLIEQGYLKLREKPRKPCTDLSREIIDWSSTVAWAWGGYYSRIFINLKGREPQGIVEPKYYEDTVKQLKNDLRKIRGPNGEQWKNEVYTPYELYPAVKGDAPDLMLFLDDLWWRAAGTIGWDTPYLSENDRGPDDAVHDWIGVFAIYDPQETFSKGFGGLIRIEELREVLEDIAGVNRQ